MPAALRNHTARVSECSRGTPSQRMYFASTTASIFFPCGSEGVSRIRDKWRSIMFFMMSTTPKETFEKLGTILQRVAGKLVRCSGIEGSPATRTGERCATQGGNAVKAASRGKDCPCPAVGTGSEDRGGTASGSIQHQGNRASAAGNENDGRRIAVADPAKEPRQRIFRNTVGDTTVTAELAHCMPPLTVGSAVPFRMRSAAW